MDRHSIKCYYDNLKTVMNYVGLCTAIIVCLVIAVCSIRALDLKLSEDSELVTKNKALFLTHCIKHDKMPWYICESIWTNFSYREKYY